jgi:hypothetical protein
VILQSRESDPRQRLYWSRPHCDSCGESMDLLLCTRCFQHAWIDFADAWTCYITASDDVRTIVTAPFRFAAAPLMPVPEAPEKAAAAVRACAAVATKNCSSAPPRCSVHLQLYVLCILTVCLLTVCLLTVCLLTVWVLLHAIFCSTVWRMCVTTLTATQRPGTYPLPVTLATRPR